MRKKARGRKEGMRRCKVCGHKLDGQERIVPVVSLQALKEYCKENGKITDDRCMCYKEALDDLLLWVKKQGVEKR